MFKAYCKDFWRYRYLLQNLIGRDFKLKYRRSVLGVLWSVLNPLLMNIVMVAVFSTLFASMHGQGISNFPVYLIIGQLLFTFFNDATTSAMSSMLGAEKVCFALVNCVFSFVALIIVMIFTGAPLHPTVVLAVYPLLTLFLFSLGVGLVLATLTVFFRDIMHLWSVFTTMLMYFSAIFYDPSQMGSLVVYGFSINMSRFIKFNPLYWYITAFRTAVLDGEMLSWSMLWICGACALVTLVFGLLVFRKQQDKFVLHI